MDGLAGHRAQHRLALRIHGHHGSAAHTDPQAIAASVAQWNQHMAILDAQLQRGGPFVFGADFTLADIVLRLDATLDGQPDRTYDVACGDGVLRTPATTRRNSAPRLYRAVRLRTAPVQSEPVRREPDNAATACSTLALH